MLANPLSGSRKRATEIITASERKSEMSPPHTELGGRSHHTFRNHVPASPTMSGTTFRGKRARTSDDKFGRHYMNIAEHGTDHYSARNRFGNRDYINGNKEKHKEESNIRSQDLHSTGSNCVAGQKSGHSQMGSLTLNSHSCRNPTPSVAEPSYPIEASTMQHSPRDDFEYTRSRLYARSSGMDFALGPNLEYSSTHSAGWLEPDE
ncbi:hypothetical protein L484_014025 [Morus notabilis]|uniref:Uncharacterized protein n=1 Tax=Morus notabilis TaxID=981085 RepID=W9RBQ8_9ROSA|nr:hypothetical protein L484_014025 [Morus notabilis]